MEHAYRNATVVTADDAFLGSVKQAPYEFSFIPGEVTGIQSGNKLRVVIYDQVRNKSEDTIDLETASD